MHHFVVRERQDEVLGVHVERGKGDQVVVPAAVDRILVHVLEDVVHPSHVPLEGEPEAAEMHGPRHAGKRGRFFGRRQRPGMFAVRQAVQLLEKRDGVEVLAAAERVRHPLSRLARVVEIQHRRDRIHAQAVDVVLLEPEERVRQQEVADLVARRS